MCAYMTLKIHHMLNKMDEREQDDTYPHHETHHIVFQWHGGLSMEMDSLETDGKRR